jgi:hypothetical protein
MTQQPEALRLAECLERDCEMNWPDYDNQMAAAAELRRLQSVNAQLLEALQRLRKMCTPELSHQEALMCRVIDAAIVAAKDSNAA